MDALGYLGLAFLGIVFYVLIVRRVFRIDEQVRNQKTIIDMLGQMLLRQGYTVEEVKAILKKYE